MLAIALVVDRFDQPEVLLFKLLAFDLQRLSEGTIFNSPLIAQDFIFFNGFKAG